MFGVTSSATADEVPPVRINTNFVTISCITIAGIIEAYQQALSGSPLAATRLPQLDGAWHYAPLTLLVIGGVFWVAGRASKATSKTPPSIAVTTTPIPPGFRFPQSSSKIAAKLSPAQLCQFFKDHTTFDAKKLAAPYVGTWLFISGKVYNVDVKDSGDSRISVDEIEGVSGLVSCRFGKQWQKQVEMFKRGNEINVGGKIYDIDASGIMLEESEIY